MSSKARTRARTRATAHSSGKVTTAARTCVFVDNAELNDVDIFEITDPANPQPVGEFDLVELADAQGKDILDDGALGDAVFLHDMVVKKIDDRFIMMADYWDAGYVTWT